MTTEIQLTPAELEMIKIKREQQELKKKEDELLEQAQLEKDIAYAEKNAAKKIADDNDQINATLDFFKHFPKEYTYIVDEFEDRVQVARWNKESKQSDVVWIKTFTRRKARFKNGLYGVAVSWHTPNSRFKIAGEWKMFITGPGFIFGNKGYTRYKTVIEKIKEVNDGIAAKAKLEDDKKDAVKTAFKQITDTYPNATVVIGESGDRHNYGRKSEWVSYPTIAVNFDNGVMIKYRVYPDGSLGRKEITFPNQNAWSLMDAMSKLSFNTEKP
jgi:hypothetical protein